jgi:hypothetical protein
MMNRGVRIFLSSTFRDFGVERDLLVRKVFPALRARLKNRFVDLVDIDLRWGITVEQAERGEVLPICLSEIDRSRPYFVCMLGERYGWVPPKDAFAADLVERHPWLEEHRGGKSVTELEIIHGVLNNPSMAGHAFFYFREPAYALSHGGAYLCADDQEKQCLDTLKDRIRNSGFPVLENYRDPEALAEQVEKALWAILDADFPESEIPDAFQRVSQSHEAYAAPRQGLYLGGAQYLDDLDSALAQHHQRILITGESGSGKSALISNWLLRYQAAHPASLIHVHYLGATADAANPVAMIRRLIEGIQRVTSSQTKISGDPQKLVESLPEWFAEASAWAEKNSTHWLIVLDSLNSLTDMKDARWLPAYLPPHIHLVVSCLAG